MKGLVPARSVGVLFGEPGSFKSFLALDVMASVATGEEFAGREVIAPGLTVLVAGEGIQVHNSRMKAWEQIHQSVHNAFMTPGAVQFHKELQLLEFIRAIREVEARMGSPCRLIVIDTLNQCSVGLDESSAKDMGIWFRAINRLRDETGATILIIHHKAKAGNYRGSTVIHSSTDFLIETSIVSPLVVKLISRKQRATAPFDDVVLQGHLVRVEGNGLEEYPVFLPSDAPNAAVVVKEKPLSPTQAVMLGILQRSSSPLSFSEWRDIAVSQGMNENTFKANRKKLEARGQVVKDNDGRYRLPDPSG